MKVNILNMYTTILFQGHMTFYTGQMQKPGKNETESL